MRRATTIGSRLPHPLKPATFSTFGGNGRGRGSPTSRFSFTPPPPPGQPAKPEGETPPSSFASPEPDHNPLGPLGHGRGDIPSANSFISAIGAGRGTGVGRDSNLPFYPGQTQNGPPLEEPNRHVKYSGHGGQGDDRFPFHQGQAQKGPPMHEPNMHVRSSGHGGYEGGQRGPPQRGSPWDEPNMQGSNRGGGYSFHPGQALRGPPRQEPNMHVRSGGHDGYEGGQWGPPQRGPPSQEPNMHGRSNRGDEYSFHPGQAQRGPPEYEPNMHVRSNRGGEYSFHPGQAQRGPLSHDPTMHVRSSDHGGYRGSEQRGPPQQWDFQERELNRDARVGTGVGLLDNKASALPGAGRGEPGSHYRMQQQEPNRHVRVGIRGGGAIRESVTSPRPGEGPPSRIQMPRQQPNRMPERETDEVDRQGRPPQWRSSPGRQAGPEGERARAGFGGGRGMEGGRGRGRGRGVEGGRGRGRGRGRFEKEEKKRMVDLSVGHNADGKLFETRVSFQVMRQLDQGFEEVISRTMPSPVDEAYLNAIDLNHRLEFEPEFLMGELDSNPDIEDKEPIPLRDALMKAKPFLMAYEGIESHEEWEEIVEETMERVPALKKIVDHYSGADRVTAKKQNEELEKVAKTLPETVPDSIKKFTDRALLSLQSNPGWEFHRKCQFMDKLVTRMSQNHR